MAEIDLKPCPFCRSEEVAARDTFTFDTYRAKCKTCTAEGPRAGSPYLAAKLWNESHPRRRPKRIVREKPKINGHTPFRSITPTHVLP